VLINRSSLSMILCDLIFRAWTQYLHAHFFFEIMKRGNAPLHLYFLFRHSSNCVILDHIILNQLFQFVYFHQLIMFCNLQDHHPNSKHLLYLKYLNHGGLSFLLV